MMATNPFSFKNLKIHKKFSIYYDKLQYKDDNVVINF